MYIQYAGETRPWSVAVNNVVIPAQLVAIDEVYSFRIEQYHARGTGILPICYGDILTIVIDGKAWMYFVQRSEDTLYDSAVVAPTKRVTCGVLNRIYTGDN